MRGYKTMGTLHFFAGLPALSSFTNAVDALDSRLVRPPGLSLQTGRRGGRPDVQEHGILDS